MEGAAGNRAYYQWGIQEPTPPPPPAAPTLFLDQTEARRSKIFFEDRVPPPHLYLRVWMTGPRQCIYQ